MDHVNKNIIIYILLFINLVLCFLITNTYRKLGNDKKVGQDALFIIGILFGLINGGTRFIWGILMDKFNFKILMFIISIIEFGVCGTIYISASNPYFFVIENVLVACCLSGTFTTITPLFNKVFGDKNGAEMFGLTGFSIGLASFGGSFLTKLYIKDESDYFILYLIGGGVCVVKFIALILFDEKKPFVYKYDRITKSKPEDMGDLTSSQTSEN